MKRARNALKKSERMHVNFGHTVRSLTCRRNIESSLRTELAGTAAGITSDMKALRGRLVCPP